MKAFVTADVSKDVAQMVRSSPHPANACLAVVMPERFWKPSTSFRLSMLENQ